MGSFNVSCFASRQTLSPGERCVVVPILQQASRQPVPLRVQGTATQEYGFADAAREPGDFWSPFGGPIEAVYRDSGRVTLRDTPASRFWLKRFFDDLVQRSVTTLAGRNCYHDLPFDFPAFLAEHRITIVSGMPQAPLPAFDPLEVPDFMAQATKCWEYVEEVASKHRLFANAAEDAPVRSLALAIVSGTAFDALRDFSRDRQARFEQLYARLQPASDGPRSVPDARQVTSLAMELQRCLAGVAQELACVPQIQDRFWTQVDAWLAATESTAHSLRQQLQPYLDLAYLDYGLRVLNVFWSPMVMAGQDETNEYGRAYARFVEQVSRSVNENLDSTEDN